MMNISRMSKVLTKYYEKPFKRYIFNKRLCSKCAKKEWEHLLKLEKDRGEGILLNMRMGICEGCKKLRLVAYIDEELKKVDTPTSINL